MADNLYRSHTPSAIRQRLAMGTPHSYLKDFIYGAVDGAVTTFAVVSGVAGADLSNGIVIILGLANLFGDGFSMAASNFLATRAEAGRINQVRKAEEEHIALIPDGEKEEVRQIFAAKGFTGEALENVVNVITSDFNRWVDTMIQEEHGLSLTTPSAVKAAWSTFSAFLIIGSIPLLPFLWTLGFPSPISPFISSTVFTLIAFFIIGAAKAKFVGQRWYWSGCETLMVGAVAATLAYGVGLFLKFIV